MTEDATRLVAEVRRARRRSVEPFQGSRGVDGARSQVGAADTADPALECNTFGVEWATGTAACAISRPDRNAALRKLFYALALLRS